MLLNLRLTIRKFWQKHKYKVIIALLIIICYGALGRYYQKNKKHEER